jgi:hypothetical protein
MHWVLGISLQDLIEGEDGDTHPFLFIKKPTQKLIG